MRKFIFAFLMLVPVFAFAVDCDCEVIVYSPLTGPHKMAPNSLKTYELESFSNYAQKNQLQCRSSCLEQFQKDMPTTRLNALLLTYSQRLIDEGALGFNCTGLTTLKYPVRVRATLGKVGLGNVVDQIYVVNHEEACF